MIKRLSKIETVVPSVTDSARSHSATSAGSRTGTTGMGAMEDLRDPDISVENPDSSAYTCQGVSATISGVNVRNFGEILRAAREVSRDPKTGRPYTQARLGELMGETHSTISGWENDKIQAPSVDQINRLAELLPVSVNDLLRGLGYRLEGQLPLTAEERTLLQLYSRADPSARHVALVTLRELQGDRPPR